MQALRQIVTVPETREILIQLPADAAPQEEAEIIVLFKSGYAQPDTRLDAVREAMHDEMFLTDFSEAMEDLQHIDAEETPA